MSKKFISLASAFAVVVLSSSVAFSADERIASLYERVDGTSSIEHVLFLSSLVEQANQAKANSAATLASLGQSERATIAALEAEYKTNYQNLENTLAKKQSEYFMVRDANHFSPEELAKVTKELEALQLQKQQLTANFGSDINRIVSSVSIAQK